MLLIVLGHSIVHGNLGHSSLIYNELSLVGMQLGSRIGVNCFVLISGYFMVESNYKREKLCSLLIQIFIPCVAACTFGIYLLHDNPQIRLFLWEQICHNQNYINSQWFIVRIIICVILVFAFGIVVEMFRKRLIKNIKRRR